MRSGIFAVAVAALMSTSASAAIQWTDWTSVTPALATGVIGGSTVTLTGPFDTNQISGGTDFWRTGGNPWAAYDALPNLPTNNDFISPSGNQVLHTFTFSKALINPYIAIISLGQGGIQTACDRVFVDAHGGGKNADFHHGLKRVAAFAKGAGFSVGPCYQVASCLRNLHNGYPHFLP